MVEQRYDEVEGTDTMEGWLRRQDTRGEREAIEAAMKESLEWGAALCAELAARKKWEHPGWEALAGVIAEDPGKAEAAGLLAKDWWTGLIEGGSARMLGDLAWDGARKARERKSEDGSGEVALRRKIIEWMPTLADEDESGNGLGWMGWSINAPGGKAVKAVLNLIGRKESRSEEAMKETLAALKDLWRGGGTGAKHVAIHVASQLPWLESIAPGWTNEIVARALAVAGERGPMREVVWSGLAHAHWNYGMMRRLMKDAVLRELGYAKGANEERGGAEGGRVKDPAIRAYASLAVGHVLFEGGSWNEWGVRGLPRLRQERVLIRLCRIFAGEEEVREAGGWEKAIKPAWDEVVAEGATTSAEQKTLLRCFADLNEEQCREFAELFEKGPPVSPDWAFSLEREEKRPIANRLAGLDVLEHCARGYSPGGGQEYWAWTGAKNLVRKWCREDPSPAVRTRIEDLLAKLGLRPEPEGGGE